MAKRKGLTIKQDKFARALARTGNGTQAAIAAGYPTRSARSIASENLTKPAVAAEVARHRARLAERLDISREKILNDQAHDCESASLQGNYAAATAGRQLIAKAMGYITERSVHVHADTGQLCAGTPSWRC